MSDNRGNHGFKGSRPHFTKTSFCYGEERNRKHFWERDQEKKSKRKGTSTQIEDSPAPVQKPSKEDRSKVISVKQVDLHIEENTEKHRTTYYDCTKSDREYKDKKLQPELVVRRGDTIVINIVFDRPYSKKKDDIQLCFSIGEMPKPSKGTKALLVVDESKNKKFKHDEWAASLQGESGNEVEILVNIPSNCIIGEWSLSVLTIAEGKQGSGQKDVFEYEHKQDVIILFNPWCKEDGVYMETEDKRQEYILNDSGLIYRGNPHQIEEKKWVFGQFEEEVLDAAMELLRSGYKDGVSLDMADPVRVSRMVTQLVNANDEDNGVVVGRWSDQFDGGVSPAHWSGSVNILRLYREKGSVRFGQCWVFSGVTTTVCRALGIPCRPVTNFSSAHDDDGTNTTEVYYDNGEPDTWSTVDSVWDFHVWNEVWMARPDLKDLRAGFEYLRKPGWQVIDATPQERSAGMYRCGPCPVQAVRLGYGTVNFDTNFVFSEVNSDIVHWNYANGDYVLMLVEMKKIGQQISTKKANSLAREDLTLDYKPPEGSKEEREMVAMALETANTKSHLKYMDEKKEKETVKFHLLHDNDTVMGKDLKIEITARNNGSKDRKIVSPKITVAATYYYGVVREVFFTKVFDDIPLKKGQEIRLSDILKAEAYLPNVKDQAHFIITARGKVEGTAGEQEQMLYKKHYFRFRRPDLKVTGPAVVKNGELVSFDVSFQNPLNTALTNCKISSETSGFLDIYDVKQEDVPPNKLYKASLVLKTRRTKKNAAVNFSFDCDQLKDVSGGCLTSIEQA